MDTTSFHAVYVDRRASCDRLQQRNHRFPPDEHRQVRKNIESLLLAFSSVAICNSAQSCVSYLSELDTCDPNPVLLLLDVPVVPQAGEDNLTNDDRHDSGLGSGPADLGLPLLKFICSEIESSRMSTLIVPVAILTEDGTPRREEYELSIEGRSMKCVDNGAWDALTSPLSSESIKALHLHCYRARKTVQKTRKRSWVGIDEPKNDNYSYLREKMVRELMMEICSPKKIKVSATGGQVKISKARAEVVQRCVGQWDFSAHDFSDEELVHCAQTMFEHAFTMPEVADYVISSGRLVDFLLACRGSYNDQIPYHNFRHVVDVLQAIFFFMLQLGILPRYIYSDTDPPQFPKSLSKIINPMDALTLMVVAVGHDVGHPGVNNAFLVTLKAPLAQVYNDKSVLESFHCAAFSQVLRKYWPKAMDMRKMMIDMILATDMGLHFDFMGKLDKLRRKFEKEGSGEWEAKTITEYRALLCALLIKCADISNVARKHDCSAKWATILIDEFARQANMERDLGIPSSLIAPPVTGSVVALAKSQVGFMNLFAIPLFENLSKVLPEMGFSVGALNANRDSWSKKIDLYAAQAAAAAAEERLAAGAKNTSPSRHLSFNNGAGSSNHPTVLGTALMDSDMPNSDASMSGSDIRSGFASPRSLDSRTAMQHAHSGNGNATTTNTSVTLVVTHPNKPPARTKGYGPVSKRPTYQHSTEHLRAGVSETSSPDRPRSSPPDLGDCSDHSCSKGCCGTAVVANGTMERRSSRFFKKVKLWKGWRKEPSDG